MRHVRHVCVQSTREVVKYLFTARCVRFYKGTSTHISVHAESLNANRNAL